MLCCVVRFLERMMDGLDWIGLDWTRLDWFGLELLSLWWRGKRLAGNETPVLSLFALFLFLFFSLTSPLSWIYSLRIILWPSFSFVASLSYTVLCFCDLSFLLFCYNILSYRISLLQYNSNFNLNSNSNSKIRFDFFNSLLLLFFFSGRRFPLWWW